MSLENHLEALRSKHSELDRAVAELEASPSSDSLEISQLKKRKLSVKEEIEQLETRH